MECHERAILHLEPFDAATLPSANGLYTRGMISTRAFITAAGKKIVACYLTSLGLAHLDRLSKH